MNKVKLLVIGAALMLPQLSNAEDYQWLTFTMTDNTEMSVAADNLSITYNEGSLKLKSATVDQAIAVAHIKSMRFTDTMGIHSISGNGDDACKSEFYNIDGVKAGEYSSVEEARESLPSGIYIVKNNNTTLKVIF